MARPKVNRKPWRSVFRPGIVFLRDFDREVERQKAMQASNLYTQRMKASDASRQ